MQNLFSKLSQTLARLTGDTVSSESMQILSARVDKLEKQNREYGVEIEKIKLLAEHVIDLQKAVSELNTISNILLSVQQQMLEEIVFPSGSSSSRSKKGSSLTVFPIVSSDDDDLPN